MNPIWSMSLQHPIPSICVNVCVCVGYNGRNEMYTLFCHVHDIVCDASSDIHSFRTLAKLHFSSIGAFEVSEIEFALHWMNTGNKNSSRSKSKRSRIE